jgi:hypothetical protein
MMRSLPNAAYMRRDAERQERPASALSGIRAKGGAAFDRARLSYNLPLIDTFVGPVSPAVNVGAPPRPTAASSMPAAAVRAAESCQEAPAVLGPRDARATNGWRQRAPLHTSCSIGAMCM